MPPDPSTLLDQAQDLLIPIAGIVAAVVGVVLCLVGGRLIKPSLGVTGLVVGGATGMTLGAQAGGTNMLIAAVAVCAIVGCVLAVWLFRVWVAVSLAVLLGLTVPAISLAWQVREPLPNAEAVETIRVDDMKVDLERVTKPDQGFDLAATVRELTTYISEAAGEAWGKLTPAAQRTLLGLAAAGAAVGLVLGLLLPKLAACLISATTGGALLLAGAFPIVHRWAPDFQGWLPADSRDVALMLGLITALAALVQWTFWRRRADK